MESQEILNLLSIPLENMNAQEAYQTIQHFLQNQSELQPEHLDLAIRHRFFKKSIEIMKTGITSKNTAELVLSLLESPVSLDTDFHFFLLFCFISNLDFSSISDRISSFPVANIESSMILLIYYLVKTNNKNVDISHLTSPYDVIINSDSASHHCIPYSFIKYTFEKKISTFIDSTYLKYKENSSALNSSDITGRIKELSNALMVTIKSLSSVSQQNQIEQFRNKFMINVTDLETYIADNLIVSCSSLRAAFASINMTNFQIDNLKVDALYSLEKLIEPFLADPTVEKAKFLIGFIKSVCISFSMSKDNNMKLDFVTSTYSFSITAAVLALLTNFAEGQTESQIDPVSVLRGYNEILKDMPEKLRKDIKSYSILSEVIEAHKTVYDPNGQLYISVHLAADRLLNCLYFCECSYLEGLIREEALILGEKSSFYPKVYKGILSKMIRPANKLQASTTKSEKDNLYQEVLSRISTFSNKLKLIPGIRKDTRYNDFTPAEIWKWPKVPGGVKFPESPEDVRKVLLLRTQIATMAEEHLVAKSAAVCRGGCGGALASIVCPKCRKLVLCYSCKSRLHKCPMEGCDVTFD